MKHYRKQECHWRKYRRSGRVKNINPTVHYHSVIRKNPEEYRRQFGRVPREWSFRENKPFAHPEEIVRKKRAMKRLLGGVRYLSVIKKNPVLKHFKRVKRHSKDLKKSFFDKPIFKRTYVPYEGNGYKIEDETS